jgi:hypothetical protein
MSTDGLMELLAHETEKLTELLAAKKFTSEYEKCKEGIKQIQVTLDIRKESTTAPHPNFQAVNFTTSNQSLPNKDDESVN